jgi:radical SAM superfamily enzyme YgiQ (UPF0313 family)
VTTRKQRIVLYNPSMAEARGGFPVSMDQLPLPLLTIAAWPARDGFEVVLIDANLHPAGEAQRRVVEACDGALLFGTTGILGHQVADGFSCSSAVRAAHPRLPMFIGGWWASVVPELQLATGLYDAVGLGQGELTFRDLAHAVESGASLEDVPGLALWRDGQLVRTAPRRVAGWDELLDPPWHLIDIAPYRDAQLHARAEREASRMIMPPGFNGRPVWGITYYSSFGCPEPCSFCCSPLMSGRRWMCMPADRMLDDLCGLHERWGFDCVRFYDANFGVQEKRVKAFCDGLIARGTPFQWNVMMQASSVLRWERGTLDVLRDAGLYHAVIGAETGDGEMRRIVGKHMHEQDNVRAAALLDQLGICTLLTYILGYPDEPAAAMLNTIDECRRIAAACPLARPMPWPFKPIPGTALYPRAVELGFQPPQTLPGWGRFGEYHLWEQQSWPNQIPEVVLRARQTFEHCCSLSLGLVRGRIGWWERRAQQRLRSGDFRFARTEARAFTLYHRLSRALGIGRDAPREIHSGIQTSRLARRSASTPMG